ASMARLEACRLCTLEGTEDPYSWNKDMLQKYYVYKVCKSHRREITEGVCRQIFSFCIFPFFLMCKSVQCTEGPVLFSSRGKLSSVHSGAKGVRFFTRRKPM